MKKNILFINPWIFDFAAYDFWSKPLGLLYLISYLGKCGFNVRYIDCLNIYNPYMKNSRLKKPKRKKYGTGKFWKQRVTTPSVLDWTKRPYYRYGITPEILKEELMSSPRPDAILITSCMTYWYLGVVEVIKIAKKIYPETPIMLGGIYAKLCEEHAKENCDADIITLTSNPEDLLNYLKELGLYPKKKLKFDPSLIYPAFSLYNKLDYICIMTSKGCPYKCVYCASPYLNDDFCVRDPDDVFEEICYWNKELEIIDFAFYDDALLVSANKHLGPLLEMVIKKGMKLHFHTPNAVHIKEIDYEIAKLMYKAGFKTIRLGLETIDMKLHQKLDRKVDLEHTYQAINYLFKAGFKSQQIGAYILVGLPNQEIDSIIKTIEFTKKMKIMPYLAEYSPIPHTSLWQEAIKSSCFEIEAEPLFHNNILLPCWDKGRKKYMPILKKMVLEIREEIKKTF